MRIKQTLSILIASKEGKKSLICIGIGIALTCVAIIFHNTDSGIPFLISILGMLLCMFGTDQFARIVYLIHEELDKEEKGK